jgi:hypothetical protein
MDPASDLAVVLKITQKNYSLITKRAAVTNSFLFLMPVKNMYFHSFSFYVGFIYSGYECQTQSLFLYRLQEKNAKFLKNHSCSINR